MTENNYRAGALTNDQSAILIACAHRLDEVGSQYLAEELRSVQRDLLAASPVQQPAAAPIPADDLEQMTPNQRRAVNKGLAALETMADLWAVETRLTDMSERIAAVADEAERAKRIAAMIHLGFVEGAYRHCLDHKDSQPAPAPADEQPAAAPIPYEGLTEEFTDEVTRLAGDAPGIREAVSAALENCNAIIAPQGNAAPAPFMRADAHECLMDVVSHHDNIVAGFAAQRLAAQEAQDSDTVAYWNHEIDVAHRMKAQAERALAAVERPAAAPIEEMIRFCPECGRLGDIPAGYEACCPDWSQARIVPKRFAELCAETFRLCVSQPFPKSSAAPVDERAAFALAMVEAGYHEPEPSPFSEDAFKYQRDQDRYIGFQLGRQSRASSANETGAPIGWAWISPTGHVSRFTADFDGKHDQLVQGWKVRPVAFCDSVANETGAEGENDVTLDRRDLFDFARGAIKSALEDYKVGEGMTQCWYWQEATNRAEALLEALDTKSPYIGAPAQAAEQVAQGAPLTMALNPNATPLTMTLGPAQAAEPVAWMVLAANTRQPCEVTLYKSETEALRQDCVVPLYAAPQHPAQTDARDGLTDEQRAILTQAADFLELKHSRVAAQHLRALLQGANQ
ncbi:hypothetical protein [Burkholderia multivorans]|uniref:hypothetical protein n=1 Tax=Burkholderia multivorans TaxID=87883 RepID=UPI0006A598F9|nr:hypothetical protein [Burkholderia multivorans]